MDGVEAVRNCKGCIAAPMNEPVERAGGNSTRLSDCAHRCSQLHVVQSREGKVRRGLCSSLCDLWIPAFGMRNALSIEGELSFQGTISLSGSCPRSIDEDGS
jgi:hypothetical protein